MPWAEQREFEFIEEPTLDSLNYPLDTGYLKKPVWIVKHNLGHQVAAVVYDGKFGMYRFTYLTGGVVPSKLDGMYRTKEEIIKKAKAYLSQLPESITKTTQVPFTKEAVEEKLDTEKVEEIVSEAKKVQKDETLVEDKKETMKLVKRAIEKQKTKERNLERKNMFTKLG